MTHRDHSLCVRRCALSPSPRATRKKDAAEEAPVHPTVTATVVTVAPQAFTETLGAIGTVVSRAGHAATSERARRRVVLRTFSSRAANPFGSARRSLSSTRRHFRPRCRAPTRRSPLRSAQTSDSNGSRRKASFHGKMPSRPRPKSRKARAEAVAAKRIEQLSILRSPINGVVTRMSATLGASVDPAQPIVEISDPDRAGLCCSASRQLTRRECVPGAKVAVSAGQSATGEPLGVGFVLDVAGTVDTTTRSVAVRVQAPTTRRRLRIGETVFGAIAVGMRAHRAIVIPLEALVPEGEEFKVFVVDANCIAHEREVKVGGRTSTVAEILEGLTAGERVVTSGAYGVADSAKVVAPATARRARLEERKSRERKAVAVRPARRAAALRLSGDRAC